MLPAGRSHYRTAAGGKHTGRGLRKFANNILFKIAECHLTFALEKLPDRAANALLDNLVRIDKFDLKPPSELPAYGGFT